MCDDYRVDTKPSARPAIIICPGGGWMTLSEREGGPVALEFARRGYMAFVFHYSVSEEPAEPGDFGLIKRALNEMEVAYYHLQSLAKENTIDKDMISVMGFSAGGQLASLFASRHGELYSCILSYPILDIEDEYEFIQSSACPQENMQIIKKCFLCTGICEDSRDEWYRIDPIKNIAVNMPSTFIWHGAQDDLVRAKGSMNYALRLMEYGIRTEIHIYDNCGHGISLGTRETAAVENEINDYCTVWFAQLIRWMEELKNEKK